MSVKSELLREMAGLLNEIADLDEQSEVGRQSMSDARDDAIAARNKLRESIEAAERG